MTTAISSLSDDDDGKNERDHRRRVRDDLSPIHVV